MGNRRFSVSTTLFASDRRRMGVRGLNLRAEEFLRLAFDFLEESSAQFALSVGGLEVPIDARRRTRRVTQRAGVGVL
jgi:hypothetical protein